MAERMKALSIRQPIAYLAGCLLGDAWISAGQRKSPNGYLCLRVADVEFAQAFAAAIVSGFGVPASVTRDERGYHLVRKNNGHGRFNVLRDRAPCSTDEERCAWLLGLFDSEGNVVCVPKPSAGPRSWDRRVAVFSTNIETLDIAVSYLDALGIATSVKPWSCGFGHKGDKPVSGLLIRSGRHNFRRFDTLIGSNIPRKARALALCHATYQSDFSVACRETQALGAAVRRARRDAGGRD